MFEVLILEDEEYNREFLKKIVGELPEVTAVYATSSGEEAVVLAQKHKPNLALLDIELSPGDFNGLTVAKSIFSNDQDCFIVFITGYTKYALQSFSVHPYDYIVKPINKAKLKSLVIEIAEQSNNYKNNRSAHISKWKEVVLSSPISSKIYCIMANARFSWLLKVRSTNFILFTRCRIRKLKSS